MDDWLELTLSLWPHADRDELRTELEGMIGSHRGAAFITRTLEGEAVGFIDLSLRHDYVPGATASPVAFIEGVFVAEAFRGQGVAAELVRCAEGWARQKGCSQLASDARLENTESHAFHAATGFSEVERVVFFVKTLL